MSNGRSLINKHRGLFLLLILCAIAARALIPSGYMIAGNSRTFTVEICSDGMGERMTRQIEIQNDGGSHAPQTDHGKVDGNCAFASLGMAGVAGAHPELLAIALAFILLLGLSATSILPVQRLSHLRPPLRGPPAAI